MIYKDGKKVTGLYRDGKAITKAFRDGKLVWQKDGADVKYVKRITAEMPSPRSPEYYYLLGVCSSVGDTTTTGYADITIKGTSFRARGSGKKEGAKFAYATTAAATQYVYVDVPESMKLSTKNVAVGDTFYADIKVPAITTRIDSSFLPTTSDSSISCASFQMPTPFYPGAYVVIACDISVIKLTVKAYLCASMSLALRESDMLLKLDMGTHPSGSYNFGTFITEAQWKTLLADVSTWGTVQPSFGIKITGFSALAHRVKITGVSIKNAAITATLPFKIKSIVTY